LSSTIKASAKRNRILAVAIVMAGHLAIGTGLLLERPQMAVGPATVIDVQLAPLMRPRMPFEPARRAIPAKRAFAKDQPPKPAPPASNRADARQSPPPPQAVPTNAGPTASAPTPQGPPEADARLASALRGTVGCSATALVHLSASEREACQQWARRLGAGFATANLGVDPSKRLAFEDAAKKDWLSQPFLAQKPHNGCVPRVSSASDLPGKAPQQTFVGIACAISF